MHLAKSLSLIPFCLALLATAVPLAAPQDHYTEAEIMQLRLSSKDEVRPLLSYSQLCPTPPVPGR